MHKAFIIVMPQSCLDKICLKRARNYGFMFPFLEKVVTLQAKRLKFFCNIVTVKMKLETLITECTAFDFKLMLEENRPKSWLKSVSAFANGYGGSLFFGIDNDGIVRGVDDVQHVCETISIKIRDYMDPLPEVEMIPHLMDGLQVLQLKVISGRYTPYYYVGDGQRVAYVRNGDESIPATSEQMVRLVLKGSNKTFDSLNTDYKVDDYSFTILANTFKTRTNQKWDKKYLLSFGLVTNTGDLTNAGALFSDDCNLSQSRLYCTRWNGLEKSDAINDSEFKGNILLLLREAMDFVKVNTRKGWEKLPHGRKNKPEYAERAVLEALVNHFIHRDYTVMGGEVHLDIYDDRLAITSPGGMYSGQKIQDLALEEISSERRNPILADVMAQLDYMEKRGSGLKRICNETKALDGYREELKPVFKSTASQFMTIIYSMGYDISLNKTEEGQVVTKQSLSSHQVIVKLSLSVPMTIELLRKMVTPMSAKDMRHFCGQKDSSYFKAKFIDPLIAEGLLAMTHPNSPKSPTQKYYLTDLGREMLKNETEGNQTMGGVSEERVNRLIAEFEEALPHFPISLPHIEEQYKSTLPVIDVRCFPAAYKMKKEMFKDNGIWIYETPELYLHEIQGNIWQHYNVQFLMHHSEASYKIRFSEIKDAFKSLGIDGRFAIITSFNLGTYDKLYGGDIAIEETEFGYQYGDIPIYQVPSHESHLIVMLKEKLPRCETKIYEGPNIEYKLINERHLLYSNIFNMRDEGDGLGLAVMRDIKFYYPDENDFHYVKLVVDRMERIESDLIKIREVSHIFDHKKA